MSLFGWLFGNDENKKPEQINKHPDQTTQNDEDKNPERINNHLDQTFQSSTENPWTSDRPANWPTEDTGWPRSNWTPWLNDTELGERFREGLGEPDKEPWRKYAPLSYADPMKLHDFSKLIRIGDTYYNPDKTPLTGNAADLPSLSKGKFTADKYEQLSAYRDEDFNRGIRGVLYEEGGYKKDTHQQVTGKDGKTYDKIIDPETHYGITPVFLKDAIRLKVPGADKLDLKLITPRQAARLYEEVIWRSKTLRLNQLDRSNPDLMDLLLDTAVNFGYIRAGKMINSIVTGKGKSCKVDVDAFNNTKDKWLLYYDIVQDRMRRHDKGTIFSKGQLARDKRFLARIPKKELERITALKKNATVSAPRKDTTPTAPKKNITPVTPKKKVTPKKNVAAKTPKKNSAQKKKASANQQRKKAPTGKQVRKADLSWPLADPMTTERNYPLAEA